MKKTAVIFDLDGTLLDTLDDLAACANAALASCGLPQRPIADIRRFVGNGIRALMERSVPENTPEATFAQCFRAFRAHYDAHLCDHTRPYAGIVQTLEALRIRGVKMAVLSNKYDAAVRRLCAEYFGENAFAAVRGHIDGTPKKPNPQSLLALMAQLGALPEATLYVGDTETDVQTAAAAGVEGAFVFWGFRTRAALEAAGARDFLERPEALLNRL